MIIQLPYINLPFLAQVIPQPTHEQLLPRSLLFLLLLLSQDHLEKQLDQGGQVPF